MNRTQLSQKYGICLKTFNRRLRTYFQNEFEGIRTFTPGQIARIIDILGAWEVEIQD